MALTLLRNFIPKSISVIRPPRWRQIDGQNIAIIKREASTASKRPPNKRGGRQKINGGNTGSDKNSTGPFRDQKSTDISTTDGRVFDATSKKNSGAANN